MKPSRGVIVAPPSRVGKRVVCVVDALEFAGAGWAGGVGGRDAVWVGFEGGFFVGGADLVGGRSGWDLEDGVVVYECF